MKKLNNFSNMERMLNSQVDYEELAPIFHEVIANILENPNLNEYPPQSILDAVLRIDLSKHSGSSDLYSEASENIHTDDYHPQLKVIQFMIFVIWKYSRQYEKSVREVFSAFLKYGLFSDMQRSYLILHTQGTISIAQNLHDRGGVRQNQRDAWNIQYVPNDIENMLASIIPDIRITKKNNDLTRAIVADAYQELIEIIIPPMDYRVAVACIISKLLTDSTMQDIVSRLDLEAVAQARREETLNLFDNFAKARRLTGVSNRRWMFATFISGAYPFFAAQQDDDEIERISELIIEAEKEENRKIRERRKAKGLA